MITSYKERFRNENEKNNFVNIERKVQRFFQKQAESLKASKDLWPKLEPRLGEKVKDVHPNNTKGRLWQWFAGPRLVAISASVAVVLILIAVGSLWLTANHSANTLASYYVRWANDHAWTGWQCSWLDSQPQFPKLLSRLRPRLPCRLRIVVTTPETTTCAGPRGQMIPIVVQPLVQVSSIQTPVSWKHPEEK